MISYLKRNENGEYVLSFKKSGCWELFLYRIEVVTVFASKPCKSAIAPINEQLRKLEPECKRGERREEVEDIIEKTLGEAGNCRKTRILGDQDSSIDPSLLVASSNIWFV